MFGRGTCGKSTGEIIKRPSAAGAYANGPGKFKRPPISGLPPFGPRLYHLPIQELRGIAAQYPPACKLKIDYYIESQLHVSAGWKIPDRIYKGILNEMDAGSGRGH